MKEKLVIKNFGPIKSVELELGRFNVLIGEQATGKSTVAKVLIAIQNTVFRDLLDLESSEHEDRNTQLFHQYLKITGIENYCNPNTMISYSELRYSFVFDGRVDVIGNIFFESRLKFDFTYIPAERDLAIILADSLFALMQTGTALPQLLLRFGDKYQKSRKNKVNFDYIDLLKISFSHGENGDLIKLPSGKEIPINESSTGIQGAVALLVVFDYVTQNNLKGGNLLIVEEPELNLFPETQNKLIKYFLQNTRVNASSDYKNNLIITTHSPYILTSINELMYAGLVGKDHPEEVEKIIEKKYWLDADEVSVYRMMSDGTAKNIIDPQLKQIDVGELDEISRSINEVWDKIADIAYGERNEA